MPDFTAIKKPVKQTIYAGTHLKAKCGEPKSFLTKFMQSLQKLIKIHYKVTIRFVPVLDLVTRNKR